MEYVLLKEYSKVRKNMYYIRSDKRVFTKVGKEYIEIDKDQYKEHYVNLLINEKGNYHLYYSLDAIYGKMFNLSNVDIRMSNTKGVCTVVNLVELIKEYVDYAIKNEIPTVFMKDLPYAAVKHSKVKYDVVMGINTNITKTINKYDKRKVNAVDLYLKYKNTVHNKKFKSKELSKEELEDLHTYHNYVDKDIEDIYLVNKNGDVVKSCNGKTKAIKKHYTLGKEYGGSSLVNLKAKNGKYLKKVVTSIMFSVFKPPIKGKLTEDVRIVAVKLDGDYRNDTLHNLEYYTISQYINKSRMRGSHNGVVRMTDAECIRIFEYMLTLMNTNSPYMSFKEIFKLHGYPYSLLRNAMNRIKNRLVNRDIYDQYISYMKAAKNKRVVLHYNSASS